MARHFISDTDVTPAEQARILDRASELKAWASDFESALRGKTLGMLFNKSSMRTRVSFEAGMHQLGGHAIFMAERDGQMARGESIADTAQVLSRYVNILLFRTFSHKVVEELANNSRVPVINALDDYLHPCQALADLLTIRDHYGSLKGQQLVYVGDGNNMVHSLLLAGAMAGMHVRCVSPEGYKPAQEIVTRAQEAARPLGARIEVTSDLRGLEGADVVYTDVWTSMGQEAQSAKRLKDFDGFQVNNALMKRAKSSAIFLHCLPAHRGEEVAAEVIDGPQSRVYDQAENRLHVQKALMLFLLGQ